MLKIFYILSIFLLFDQFNARATDYDDILQDFQEINDIKDIQSLSTEIKILQGLPENVLQKESLKEKRKALNVLKLLLGNLQSKGGSAFKSVPYAPKVVNKYVNAYLKQIDELEKKMKPSKRAVCGNLNGNQAYKWICW